MTRSRTLKLGAVAAVLVLVTGLASACGGSSNGSSQGSSSIDYGLVHPGTITAAITTDGAPFASNDANGKPIGLLIDLNDYIAEQLGLKIVYKNAQQDAAFAGLTSGQYDMMSIGLIETPERLKNVTFTKPIYWSQNVAVVHSDSPITSAADLAGKRVGVSQDSAQAEYAAANFKQSKIVQEPDNTAGIQQLLNGNLDTFFMGSGGASVVIPQHSGDLKVSFSVYLDSPSAEAINSKLPQFLDAYNAELTKAANSGALLKIYDKYFKQAGLTFPDQLYQYYPQVKQQIEARGSAPSPSS